MVWDDRREQFWCHICWVIWVVMYDVVFLAVVSYSRCFSAVVPVIPVSCTNHLAS